MKKSLKKTGFYLVCALILAAGAFASYPFLKMLGGEMTEERLTSAREMLDGLGVFKYPAILLLQILQVLIAFLPGEPMEILAGYTCGTFGGLAVCLLGIAIGTAIIYFAVRKWGWRLVDKVGNSKPYERLTLLNNNAARDGLLFLLFFIPGTPKDVLTYFAPFLKIGPGRLLLIVTVARIPSVISSTYVGATLSEGNLAFSVFVFVLTGAVGLVGIGVNDLLLERKGKTVNES